MLLVAHSARHKRMGHLGGQEAEGMSNHAQLWQHLHCRYLSEVEKPLKVLIHDAGKISRSKCFLLAGKKEGRCECVNGSVVQRDE